MEYLIIIGLIAAIWLMDFLNDKRNQRKLDEGKPDEMQCPVCGYYCLGRGGHGCINKVQYFENNE